MKSLIFIFLLFLTIENSGQVKLAIVIKDEQCAKEIANIIFRNVFGDSIVNSQMPFEAELKDSLWVVQGKPTIPTSDRIKLDINNKNAIVNGIYPKVDTNLYLVKDSISAIKVTSVIWNAFADEDFIERYGYYVPYKSILINKNWVVYFAKKEELLNCKNIYEGGLIYIHMRKKNCEVLEIYIGK